jgi:hypothetical protein
MPFLVTQIIEQKFRPVEILHPYHFNFLNYGERLLSATQFHVRRGLVDFFAFGRVVPGAATVSAA